MKPPTPPAVENVYAYWLSPPPARSLRCAYWCVRLQDGWHPNKRVRRMGYQNAAPFFGVYVWEYLHVIAPQLRGEKP